MTQIRERVDCRTRKSNMTSYLSTCAMIKKRASKLSFCNLQALQVSAPLTILLPILSPSVLPVFLGLLTPPLLSSWGAGAQHCRHPQNRTSRSSRAEGCWGTGAGTGGRVQLPLWQGLVLQQTLQQEPTETGVRGKRFRGNSSHQC